jgi:hypothetical protein
VQIVVLTIPNESMFRAKDAIWFAWVMIALGILIVISLFEKCVIGVKRNVIET